MIKSMTIEFEEHCEWEVKAYMDASKNHLLIESLYDDVFRPHLKYDAPIDHNIPLSDVQHDAIEKIWEKVRDHFKE